MSLLEKRNDRSGEQCERCHKLEEKNNAMKDQLQLQENDLSLLKEELKASKENYHQKKKYCEDIKDHYSKQVTQLNKTVEELKCGNQKLKLDVKCLEDDSVLLRKERQSVQAKLFEATEDLERAEKETSNCEQLRLDYLKLQQESLILGELYEKTREKNDILNTNYMAKSKVDEQCIIMEEALRREIKTLETNLNVKSTLLEGFKAKNFDLEASLNKKDVVISEYEQLLNKVKFSHETQLNVEKQRIESLERVNNRLEQHILKLYSQLGLQRHESRLKEVIAMKKSDVETESESSSDIETRFGNNFIGNSENHETETSEAYDATAFHSNEDNS